MTLAHRSASILAALTLAVTAALARNFGSDSFDLSWNTIDGGGGACSGGAFELSSTIGQPDAQIPPVMSGGSFELVGGLWPGIAPAAETCQADIQPVPNGDGLVNVDDLLFVISHWGACPIPPAPCPADIAPQGGDGVVNVDDLLTVINGWGVCQL